MDDVKTMDGWMKHTHTHTYGRTCTLSYCRSTIMTPDVFIRRLSLSFYCFILRTTLFPTQYCVRHHHVISLIYNSMTRMLVHHLPDE